LGNIRLIQGYPHIDLNKKNTLIILKNQHLQYIRVKKNLIFQENISI